MLDIFTLLNLEEWENEDQDIENGDIATQIIDDWENLISENPEASSELHISGELVATYPGLHAIPEHGISLDSISPLSYFRSA